MKFGLFSVFDKLANVYLQPFVARGSVEACRQVTATLKAPEMAQSALVQSPSDYTVVQLADWDDETGVVVCLPRPLAVADVVSLMRRIRDVSAAPEGGLYDDLVA